MTLIFRSNVAYAGAEPLPSIEAIAYSAQDLYDLYEARVVADGGVIESPSETLWMVNYVYDNDLRGRIGALASPAWGVKKSAGRAAKLYSIEGVDFEGMVMGGGGALPNLTTDAAGNYIAETMLDTSSVGGVFRSVSDVTLAASSSDWCALIGSISGLSGSSGEIAFGNVPTGGTGFICASLTRTATLNGYGAQKSGYNAAAASDATKRMTANASNTGRVDTDSTALALNIATGGVRVIMKGGIGLSATSDTGALTDYTTLSRRIYIGSSYNGSATISRPRNGQFRYAMHLKSTTVEEVQRITLDMSNRLA